MKILDSNLIIYASQPAFAFLRPLLTDPDSHVSEITRLEVLGYHLLDAKAKAWFETAFSQLPLFPVDKRVIDKAIELRQQRKISVGDAINAATALLNKAELYTRNVKDFTGIPVLKVVNPIP